MLSYLKKEKRLIIPNNNLERLVGDFLPNIHTRKTRDLKDWLSGKTINF